MLNLFSTFSTAKIFFKKAMLIAFSFNQSAGAEHSPYLLTIIFTQIYCDLFESVITFYIRKRLQQIDFYISGVEIF